MNDLRNLNFSHSQKAAMFVLFKSRFFPGIRTEVEELLCEAIYRKVKPVVLLDYMNRVVWEMSLDKEDAYQTLHRIIESINVIIATYCDEDAVHGNWQVGDFHQSRTKIA